MNVVSKLRESFIQFQDFLDRYESPFYVAHYFIDYNLIISVLKVKIEPCDQSINDFIFTFNVEILVSQQ
jgi:hypothetical protein